MNWEGFKPMLLSNSDWNPEDLDYKNLYASQKLDGVRIEVTHDGLYGRSLKRIPNEKLQAKFKPICDSLDKDEIIECEIWSDYLPCRVIAGICNSKSKDNKDVDTLKLYAFDYYSDSIHNDKWQREELLDIVIETSDRKLIRKIDSTKVQDALQLQDMYLHSIDVGLEGLVIMDYSKPYKKGRVTIKQHIGFKMKPHKEEDLEIINVTERMENLNESTKDELGHSVKRNTIDDKRGTGIAATFICRMPSGNETTGVTITGTEDFRREIFKNKEEYIGRYAVVKSMDYGAKDKLRHPRLLSIKEKIEK